MHRKKARFASSFAAVAVIVWGIATLAPRAAYAHAVSEHATRKNSIVAGRMSPSS